MRFAIVTAFVVSLSACGASVFVTPEGNIALGPRNAATAPAGVVSGVADRETGQPQRHIARSAFDTWRPAPLGTLPPDNILRNTAEAITLQAGSMTATLRASDRIVPAWGGDVYLRVDLHSGTPADRPAPRDLVVVMDLRDRTALARQRRIAMAVFDTMRPGDHGALVTSGNGGSVVVPLLPVAAAPLLRARAASVEASTSNDLAAALERAVPMVTSGTADHMRRLLVLSSSSAILGFETRQWIETAVRGRVEVVLAPLATGTAVRFERLAAATQATALAEIHDDDHEEHTAIDELAALPPMHAVAQNVSIDVASVPGPMHLLDVFGAGSVWTPGGGAVPVGVVYAGDDRTFVLRGLVPPWRDGAEFELAVRLHFHDESGDHEVRRAIHSVYSDSPEVQASSRAGDILQYVSLLNTISNVQSALAHDDPAAFASLRGPALTQAHTLQLYAREHRDDVMSEQASLLRQLLDDAPLSWTSQTDAP